MKPTQANRILHVLNDGAFHCVTEFMEMHIPDYRRRLCDIKDRGITLKDEECTMHRHEGGCKMWKLESVPTRKYIAHTPKGDILLEYPV